MRQKPDELGLCHADGCGRPAAWQAMLSFRGTPIKGATTVKVCDTHRPNAVAYVLNDENRARLVSHLVAENYADWKIANGMVRHNVAVEFEPVAP